MPAKTSILWRIRLEISSGTSSEESDMSSERNVGWDFGISDLDWEDERIWGCCCCSYECMQIFQLAGYETKTNLKSSSCLQHIPCLMFSLQLFLGFPNPLLWQNTDSGLAGTESPADGLEPTFSILNTFRRYKQILQAIYGRKQLPPLLCCTFGCSSGPF